MSTTARAWRRAKRRDSLPPGSSTTNARRLRQMWFCHRAAVPGRNPMSRRGRLTARAYLR